MKREQEKGIRERRRRLILIYRSLGYKPATNEDARNRSFWRLNRVYSQGIGPCIVPFSLSDLAASFPTPSVSRLCRRWVLRVSSNPHPSALQAANPRVTPRLQLSCLASRCSLQVTLNSASSGSSGDGSSSFLESRILQRCLRLNLQVSPSFQLSASPCDESSGFPYSSSSGCRRWFLEFPRRPASFGSAFVDLRVPPATSSSIASRSFPGSPRFLNLPALPAMVLRVASSPASFSGPGGVKLRVAPSPRSSSIACR